MLILEGLVTTLNQDGSTNVSPMGPEVEASLDQLVLKPYQSSTTFQNLRRAGQGVFHVTDDVEMIARAAVGPLDPLPPLQPAEAVRGQILSGACRWYAFEVRSLDQQQERTRLECQVVSRGTLREFFGFNRAKHAVLEAAILATRTAFLPAAEILPQFERFGELVRKTGGPAEHRALDFLFQYVTAQYSAIRP